MKDGQKQYRILRIDEPDFGCEGRDDGEAAYDEITLVNEQGETCLVRMEEQQVWSMGLDEGMLAWVGKDGQIRGRCKRMDISRWSEKYQVRALTEQDVGAIYELSRKNNLYYEYCPPYVTRDSILSDLVALPPGKLPDDKYYVGFFRGETLLAQMDLIADYPERAMAYIGLFMMEASVQQAGIGTRIMEDLCRHLAEEGIRTVRLCWVKGNPQAEHFWRKNQFAPIRETQSMSGQTVVLAERRLK